MNGAGTGGALGRWRELAAGDAVLLDGFHAVKHALRFGADVPLALAADREGALRLAGRLAPDLADRLASLLTPVAPAALAGLLERPHPTGVAALAVPARRVPAHGPAPVVLLDNPRHLGNIGAVIRVAAGAGARGVLTTGTADPWHPAVLRAAAGLHFATAVDRVDPAAGLPPGPLLALDPAGTDLRATRIEDGAVLAFGSERAGLSPEVRQRADALVALPMREGVSSYNLATSVAMTLYHWLARTR
ncbi:TrmH family RNA methyltransferase [Streptomyces sp. SBT349]|uniref:TrmH family RNA methyltransferase n=1 Tax=Streptomyces sp. SBT349 TaxID=1580539 RepID=UPI00066B1D25|nr:TrmH family RNA methyltransferase [Streptomyces sp. SBT349]